MRIPAPDTWRRSLARWLMALAVSMVAPGWNAAATASGSISHSSSEGDSHSCACARCRGDSCCCAPKRAKPQKQKSPAGPAKAADASSAGSGPCFSQTPCGDSGVPTPTPVGPLGKAALATADLDGFLTEETGGFARMAHSARWASPFVARPDEPPEAPAFA